MIRRLAWLIIAELALANLLNALMLLARFLASRRACRDRPPQRLVVLKHFP